MSLGRILDYRRAREGEEKSGEKEYWRIFFLFPLLGIDGCSFRHDCFLLTSGACCGEAFLLTLALELRACVRVG